ncbi:MAG: carboxypeptidase-like regulatory domain-containing protein, partial [Muribaculaceae bacterium]|nr:carboxypeptidase-like regulatory domain-containing protein [Muribaculaceae bacterium]
MKYLKSITTFFCGLSLSIAVQSYADENVPLVNDKQTTLLQHKPIRLDTWAENITGLVTDENKQPLPYSTVRIMNRKIGCLSDSTGRFSLHVKGLNDKNDTLLISYLGYETKKIPLRQLREEAPLSFELSPAPTMLKEVSVYPGKKNKTKTKKKGKNYSWGLLKGFMDGKTAGETFGYEFHAKKNKTLVLDKVGFFCCDGYNRMTKMKFRINVYDMSKVTTDPSKDFVSVLNKPVYFDYVLTDDSEKKFEYELPQQIILPKDAMVEIEMLEDLNEEKLWYRCNLV